MNNDSLHNLERAGLLPGSLSLGKTEDSIFITPTEPGANVQGQLSNLRTRVLASTQEPVENRPSKLAQGVLVAVLLFIAVLAHGFNMFQFPYYENDEGTYISQAWSVVESGSLSPYTFWYDHAPAGWFFIAIFSKLVGGFFAFGSSIDTGRVFMLVLHAASVWFVFYIGKRLTNGKLLPGFLAGLIFAVSPLAIYFQRRVLLDNIMVFWVLLALVMLLLPKLKLRQAILSAVFFGIAILTKETAIFFLPAFVYAVWVQLHTKHRLFGVTLWVTISGLVVSLYPIYALLKSEFFPDTWFGGKPHVSLLETLSLQASRGNTFHFWQAQSDFYKNAAEWFSRDPILTLGGAISVVLALVLCYKVKSLRIPLLASLGMLFFLMRGGLVINFYLLPLIPFLALLMGSLLEIGARKFSEYFVSLQWAQNTRIMYIGAGAVTAWAITMSLLLNPSGLFTVNETAPMKEAVTWAKANLKPTDTLIIDNAIFVDIRESRFSGDPAFNRAEWFWKVEKDEAVYKKQLASDWLNVDYVLLSHEMVRQAGDYQIDRIKEILPNSALITGWSNGGAHIDLPKYISTNGDWMRVYKVTNRDDFALDGLWKADKAANVQSYGQVVDEQGNTTAHLQGEAMLRAVLAGDRTGFNGLWSWTHDHLAHRTDTLVSEQWGTVKGVDQVTNPEAYLASNQDIATALILAGRKWNNSEYVTAGESMVNDIWTKLAVTANGRTVLAESTKRDVKGNARVHTGAYAPAYYKVFAQVSNNPWDVLANESYEKLPRAYAPAQVFTVNKKGKVIAETTQQGDVSKAVLLAALDAQWFKSEQAKHYLEESLPALRQQASEAVWNENDTALLAALSQTDPEEAEAQYGNVTTVFFNRTTVNWAQQYSWSAKSNLWLTLTLYAKDSKTPELASQEKPHKVSTIQ